MALTSLVPVDRVRAEQFMLLGSVRRLFDDYQIWTDAEGIVWARTQHNGYGFGLTWLGSGWVYDPHARQRRPNKLAAAQAEMAQASKARHRRELEQVRALLHLGRHSERVLWFILQCFRTSCRSVLRLPDRLLAQAVWGQDERQWPSHWRMDLLEVL